jgi:hypothetical protein
VQLDVRWPRRCGVGAGATAVADALAVDFLGVGAKAAALVGVVAVFVAVVLARADVVGRKGRGKAP